MSNSAESEFDLERHFLPAWAQQPANKNPYAHFRGEAPPSDRDDRRRRPGAGGRNRGMERRSGGGERFSQNRPASAEGAKTGAPRGEPRRDRGDRGGRDRVGRGRDSREGQRPIRPELPLPEVGVDIIPDDIGVDSLAKQIRMTGRAYPLFDIARMVLQKPERHGVTLSVRKNGEGQAKQPLYSCAIDQSIWLSSEEAVRHVISRFFQLFYQAEKTPIDPPKGTYTFVAQCGMSGVILGPPNHHDYQNQLRKLHAARFSKMPFEAFKSRVRIVKDEEVVKQWLEDQSFRTEYVCLNLPEPLRLSSREEVESHFRATHLPNIIQTVESFNLKGTEARNIRSSELARLVRVTLENQKRFPLQVATVLSQQFASRGLQFFKVNRSITHVAVARPHFLDLEATPVSGGIKRLVLFINEHAGCTRRMLLDGLVPAAARPAPAAAPAAPGEGEAGAPAPATASEPSAEETTLITDLHWLIHQGHVIEFAHGILETAKKPLPKPPKPAPAAKRESQSAAVETTAATTGETPGESAPGGLEEEPLLDSEPAPEMADSESASALAANPSEPEPSIAQEESKPVPPAA